MNDKQKAVIHNWLETCQAGNVKVADHVLTDLECDILTHCIQAIAADLEFYAPAQFEYVTGSDGLRYSKDDPGIPG